MSKLQEYDLEIKPVHTIKGHGICRLVTKSINIKEEEEDISEWEQEIDMYNVE